MYRVFTNITIQQLTQLKTPGALPRNKTLYFDFVNEFECSDTWRDLTNDGKVIIPKNLYYVDTNGKRQPLWGTNVNIGGFTSSPLLMRGDAVTIDYGYKFFRDNKEKFEGTYNSKKNSHLFTGFISRVTSKKPIEFLIEDNMWKLKQIPAPIHTFKATDISHFDYKDYDNVIIQLCYDYYQEHCAGRLVETIDDAKRYIIQMSNWEYMRNK